MIGSNVPIMLTSMLEKYESLVGGKIGAVGRVIQSLRSQAANLSFCVPCCVGSCIIVQKQDPSTQETWWDSTDPSGFLFFPALKRETCSHATRKEKCRTRCQSFSRNHRIVELCFPDVRCARNCKGIPPRIWLIKTLDDDSQLVLQQLTCDTAWFGNQA
ncbi:hypothetical protein AVEN_58409-1 [Araneus ventricosus]|uniref:Uncharacterized protein n=1 Tax=Araneus ventricosus TaxID=182803 RepID=A0A4Y2F4P7_ARAVE|nr:hypothetical protein AVEN_58409-1 [Araneus ventricosus]